MSRWNVTVKGESFVNSDKTYKCIRDICRVLPPPLFECSMLPFSVQLLKRLPQIIHLCFLTHSSSEKLLLSSLLSLEEHFRNQDILQWCTETIFWIDCDFDFLGALSSLEVIWCRTSGTSFPFLNIFSSLFFNTTHFFFISCLPSFGHFDITITTHLYPP